MSSGPVVHMLSGNKCKICYRSLLAFISGRSHCWSQPIYTVISHLTYTLYTKCYARLLSIPLWISWCYIMTSHEMSYMTLGRVILWYMKLALIFELSKMYQFYIVIFGNMSWRGRNDSQRTVYLKDKSIFYFKIALFMYNNTRSTITGMTRNMGLTLLI